MPETAGQGDVQDTPLAIPQLTAGGLQTELVHERAEAVTRVLLKLPGKSRATETGDLEEVLQPDLVAEVGHEMLDGLRDGLLIMGLGAERETPRREQCEIRLRRVGDFRQETEQRRQLTRALTAGDILHERGNGRRGPPTQVQATFGPLEEITQFEVLRKSPYGMTLREMPLNRKPTRRPRGMPVMRQAFAEQHQIAGRERADGIAHEARALPAGKQGQFHLLMEVPVIALPLHGLRPTRSQDAFDVPERLRPAQDAEGVPFGQLDLLADGFHRVIRIKDTPTCKGVIEMIVPP